MTKQEFIILLQKYEDGTCNAEEVELLETWYIMKLRQNAELPVPADLEKRKETSIYNIRQHFKKKSSSKNSECYSATLGKEVTVKKFAKVLWLSVTVAATAAIAALITIYMFDYQSKNIAKRTAFIANTISPGNNKAILTLSDGRRISLSDARNGELAEQSGVTISKTADGQVVYKLTKNGQKKMQYNLITVPAGGQYRVCLPDGSRVWLNAVSTLKFPTNFDQGSRNVELSGEAYFEVAKDNKHSFIVKSPGQQVEVLGTHFNINTYKNEPHATTTLLEGTVRVIPLVDTKYNGQVAIARKSSVLAPGQQAKLKNNTIAISKADLAQAVAWKNGFFEFHNDDLPTVMRQLARWYDIEVVYDGAIPRASFGGKIYRNTNLNKALEILRNSDLDFIMEGRKIIIRNNQ